MTLNTDDILKNLNENQAEAVTTDAQHALVLAGAGSGKTRVLVHRIAWLISAEFVSPYSILAVTFTNKAAAEMRNRIAFMLKREIRDMWIGTFHGIALKLLQINTEAAGLPKNFQILDSDDQYRLIRRCLADLELDEKQWPPRTVQAFINDKKNDGLRAHEVDDYGDFNNQTLIKVFGHYDDHCQRAGLVDFSEMLLRAHELLLNNDEVLSKYRQRFSHILVDEFQDTNAIQSAFIQLLAGKNNKVLVVGDDDQSIYAWRGAKVDHILDFQNLYANTAMYKLEQNYRSTQNILDAANGVIANNKKRLGKNLWSAQEKGDLVAVYGSHSEFDEAFFVGETIEGLLAEATRADDIAILYRSNAQSRLLEEALLKRSIPYQIYGGLRFFERLEIKDVLAYARLVNNRHDDIGFERVINTPTRGMGLKTINLIRNYAQMEQSSLWQSGKKLLEAGKLSNRAATSLAAFNNLIDELEDNSFTGEDNEQNLANLFSDIIERTALKDHYLKEPPEKAQTRLENLDELINAAEMFEVTDEDLALGLTPLAAFLAQVSLDAGDTTKVNEPHVQLMTLHSAKGLEFPVVFIVGMEQGLFPHQNSMEDHNKLQEERRLAYVGITRAEQKLFLSYATSRRMRGKINACQPSQFLREIPKDLVKQMRGNIHPTTYSSSPGINTPYQSQTQSANDSPYQLGQTVKHKSFGEGVITDMSGKGDYLQVLVQFNDFGPKVLAVKFAKLEVI
ncbi:DNA helicase II [Marinicella sp. S1101]|uniref:DNA helicase II n=1 Tax=Marinicella marina TaxID=2996016 RepID=UPI00226084D3|nr:DNA helicase II [Marinicella marina]MCX7553004.1 DNA helicase II [Marinicella marina]MDJ1139686.1 DNA helicase II [Marinicella marina]